MIGLIPAAGHATRIHGIPKFLLPVPDGLLLNVLARRMKAAGASLLMIGTNTRNADAVDLHAPDGSCIYIAHTSTMSETVLSARPYTNGQDVLFGMPDAYWQDENVYQRLAADLNDGAMVSAALFRTRPEQRAGLGMCDVEFVDDELFIRRVIDKPKSSPLYLAWGALAWKSDFWQFIKPEDPHVGYALQRAIEARVIVRGSLALGGYWDCGTPAGYFACIRETTEQAVTA